MTAQTARDVLRRALAPDVVEAIEELISKRVAEHVESLRSDGAAGSEWLTLDQAGRMLNCSPDAVRMRAKRGRLAVRHHGRRVYVARSSVEALGVVRGAV